MTNFSITQHGMPLSKDKYTIDIKNKIFTSTEINLVLDFSGQDGWIFKIGGDDCYLETGSWCKFKTGNDCTFKTGDYCTFNTGGSCTFKTGMYCIFKTGNSCIFKTSGYCTFNTGKHGTFRTWGGCTFMTTFDCAFVTGSECTFHTTYDCTFKTGCSCTFSLWDINSCTFNSYYDEISTILDREDNEAYKLTKEFVQLQKIKHD